MMMTGEEFEDTDLKSRVISLCADLCERRFPITQLPDQSFHVGGTPHNRRLVVPVQQRQGLP